MKNQIDLNDPSIRKFRKKIAKDYWMLRIHKWAYGKTPNFKGYCVMFWGTWFLIILSPFILIGKVCEFVIKLIAKITEINFFDTAKPAAAKKKKFSRPDDYFLIKIYEFVQKNKITLKSLDAFGPSKYDEVIEGQDKNNLYDPRNFGNLWHDVFPGVYSGDIRDAISWMLSRGTTLEADYLVAKTREAARAEKQKFAEIRAAKFNEYKNKIIKYLAPTVKPILWISSVGSAVVLVRFAICLFKLISWNLAVGGAIKFGIFVGVVLAAAVGIAFLFKIFSILIHKIKSVNVNLPELPTNNFHFFDRLVGGISETFSFFWETGRLLYTKECPLIEITENETTGIFKNKPAETDPAAK